MSFLRDVVEKTLPIMNEDWIDATLYAHYQDEQALMYEYAETLAIRVFLKMAGLPFRLEQRPNAEFMSPTTGQVPFLRVENSIIAEFSSIVEFVGKKGIKLSDALTATEQSDVQAYCSLVEETLRNAEKYLCWEHNKTYNLVTKQRYSSVYSWPLKLWLPALKRLEIRQYLSDIGWGEYRLEEVVNLCDKCFHVLSVKLGTQQYFVGDQPTELDACVFGHIYTILTTEMPDKGLISSLKKYPNLIAFCKNIDQNYFKN